MIKGPGSSSTVDETDTPLVLGKEKTGISSPTLSRGANGLGGLPVSLALAIEVSFSLLYYPPPRHAPVARQIRLLSPGPERANAARPSSTPFGSAPRRASSVRKPLGRAKAALSRSSDAHPIAR